MNNSAGFCKLCRKMGLHIRSQSDFNSVSFRTLENELGLFLRACDATMKNSCIWEMPSI